VLADERKKLVELYRGGYASVVEALLKITPEQLDVKPAPGKWSVRDIIHHLADSEMTAAVRLRLLLAQDRPTIHGYDQDEFARRLYYDRPHEASLELFRLVRQSTADILDRLTPAEWIREGTHTEVGPYGVESWLKTYADHAHKHARQIRVVRDAAAKTNH
jgi:DinB family protein